MVVASRPPTPCEDYNYKSFPRMLLVVIPKKVITHNVFGLGNPSDPQNHRSERKLDSFALV